MATVPEIYLTCLVLAWETKGFKTEVLANQGRKFAYLTMRRKQKSADAGISQTIYAAKEAYVDIRFDPAVVKNIA
jgi:hypothetical protein